MTLRTATRRPRTSRPTRQFCATCSIGGPPARGSGLPPRSARTAVSSRTCRNPAYPVPIPAPHLEIIFEICHFPPAEKRAFLEAFEQAHPNRQPAGARGAEPAQSEARGLRLRRRKKESRFRRTRARHGAPPRAADRTATEALARAARTSPRVCGERQGKAWGRSMKKFLNSPQTLLDESLDGFVAAHADIVVAGEERKFVRRRTLTPARSR